MLISGKFSGGNSLNLQEALKQGIQILKLKKIEAPAVEAGVILCYVIKKNKVYIYSHGEELLETQQQQEYFCFINERAYGKPLQYITGHQEFMALDFNVNQEVLIPRQDTEVLVETTMKYIKSIKRDGKDELSILDIGTGSGCIAVSLAYYLKGLQVTALDISQKALNTARLNALNNRVIDKIKFVEADLSEYIKVKRSSGELFDIVVSNPPYIPTKDIQALKPEVKSYEPFKALDGGSDGLLFYRLISKELSNILKPGGFIALETGYNQGRDVMNIFKDSCTQTEIIKDISGNNRVFKGIIRS
jgi:release factor glutamine methyltransferase